MITLATPNLGGISTTKMKKIYFHFVLCSICTNFATPITNYQNK